MQRSISEGKICQEHVKQNMFFPLKDIMEDIEENCMMLGKGLGALRCFRSCYTSVNINQVMAGAVSELPANKGCVNGHC